MFTALYVKNNTSVAWNMERLVENVLDDFCVGREINFDPGSCLTVGEALEYIEEEKFYLFYTQQDEAEAHGTGKLRLTYGHGNALIDEAKIKAFATELVSCLRKEDWDVLFDSALGQSISVPLSRHEPDESCELSVAISVPCALHEKYSDVFDKYGENQDEEGGDIHFYLPMQEGETVLDALQREPLIELKDITSYQRCLMYDDTISCFEPFLEWDYEEARFALEYEALDENEKEELWADDAIGVLEGRVEIGGETLNKQIADYWEEVRKAKSASGDAGYAFVAGLISKYFLGQVKYEDLRKSVMSGIGNADVARVFMDIDCEHSSMI